MIKELIKISNKLDAIGLTKEADELDGIIQKMAGEGLDSDQPAEVMDEMDEEVSNPLDGMSRKEAVDFVNGVIHSVDLQGFFDDQYWTPIKDVFKALGEKGIPYTLTEADYKYNKDISDKVASSKQWKFEIDFNNNNGRPSTIYGLITASGGGPAKDPLATYDVTAYAS